MSVEFDSEKQWNKIQEIWLGLSSSYTFPGGGGGQY